MVLRTRNSTTVFAPFLISPKVGIAYRVTTDSFPHPTDPLYSHTQNSPWTLSWKKKRATSMHTNHLIFNPYLLKQWIPVGGTAWLLFGVRPHWTEHQNSTDTVEPSSSISASIAGTPVSLTLGFPPGHSEEGCKRKEVLLWLVFAFSEDRWKVYKVSL